MTDGNGNYRLSGILRGSKSEKPEGL